MSDSALFESTLASVGSQGASGRAAVPCLTVACHPDPARIGERALLTPLLVRGTVRLSRGELQFAHLDDERARPLGDPYLTREPIEIAWSGSTVLTIDRLPAKARIDGVAVDTRCDVPIAALGRGLQVQLSSRILLLLHLTANEPPTPIEGILGHSDAIEHVRRQLLRAAKVDAPVLIHGESGVGKEQAAFTIHSRSGRAAGPWVTVNMATLSESIAATTLFGHARGAFTGAAGRHRGLFERAHGGTLFLDEVGDTPVAVQPMLLRALETGQILPLGDEQERKVDVRVVAATELEVDGEQTGFRGALKHRLAGYEIRLPPLRDRLDDIPRLLVHWLRHELRAIGRESLLESAPDNPEPPLRSGLVAALMRQPLPGNVRELINLARRLAIAADDSGVFALGDLQEDDGGAHAGALSQQAVPVDETALLSALESNGFSPLRAAVQLGVAPSTVHFWMRRAGIRRATDFSEPELRVAEAACDGDLDAMAKQLRVSVRALRLVLGRRGE